MWGGEMFFELFKLSLSHFHPYLRDCVSYEESKDIVFLAIASQKSDHILTVLNHLFSFVGVNGIPFTFGVGYDENKQIDEVIINFSQSAWEQLNDMCKL